MQNPHSDNARARLPMPEFPTLFIADAAQEISNCPANSRKEADWLFAKSMEWCRRTGLLETHPDKAEYTAYRAAWNALATPLSLGIELRLLRNLLPAVLAGQSLTNITDSNIPQFGLTRLYEGDAFTIVQAMATNVALAAEQFLRQVIDTRDPYYFPVLQTFTYYHALFHPVEEAQRDARSPKQRPVDTQEAIIEFTVDATETHWSVLQRALGHFAIWGQEWEANKRQSLFSIIDQLARPASTKATLMSVYFNRHIDTEPENPKKCPFTHNDPRAEGSVFRLPRLEKGKQHPPGFCTANSIQRAHDRSDRERIERLRDKMSGDANEPRRLILPYGTISPVSIRNSLMGYTILEVIGG